MDLSKLKQTPTHEQELDYQDELIRLFNSGKEKGFSLREMAQSVQQKVFNDVKDLREENHRLGMALKSVQQKSKQGSLL